MEKDRPEAISTDIIEKESMIASFEGYLSTFEALLKSEGDILELRDSKKWLIFWQANVKKILNSLAKLKALAQKMQQYQQVLPSALLDRYAKASKLDAKHELIRLGTLDAYMELGQVIGDRGLKC